MKLWKFLLLPFAALYGLITITRNLLYDINILNSYQIPIKSICIGNLSVGGTGKSPLVIAITDHLLSAGHHPAILSRGYGRNSKGLVQVSQEHNSLDVGDELLQYQNRFGDQVVLVAAESRKNGVEYILKCHPMVDIILLDDAFQHRRVTAGLNIIVTPFHKPFFQDYLLPVGFLRERRNSIRRADLTVISKCPGDLTKEISALYQNNGGKQVHFSRITYGSIKAEKEVLAENIENVVLVTGIGDPSPLIDHLSITYSIKHIKFRDHHNFTATDFKNVADFFGTFAPHNTIILTTEKDYMRVRHNSHYKALGVQWCYQEMNVELLDKKAFFETIDRYVGSNS